MFGGTILLVGHRCVFLFVSGGAKPRVPWRLRRRRLCPLIRVFYLRLEREPLFGPEPFGLGLEELERSMIRTAHIEVRNLITIM